jgi:hypothetical protein
MLFRLAFYIFLSLSFCLNTVAQNNDLDYLLKDTNIVWVADFEQDYRFEPQEYGETYPVEVYNWNQLALRKYLQLEAKTGFYGFTLSVEGYWQTEMLNKIKKHDGQAFADPLLEHRLTDTQVYQILFHIDTLVRYYESSGDEPITVIWNELNAKSLVGVRMLHRVFLNKNTGLLGLETLSWSPLLGHTWSQNFGYVKRLNDTLIRPLAWFEVKEAMETDSVLIQSKNITYAVETATRNNSPAFKSMVIRKGSLDPQAYFEKLIQNPDLTLWGKYEDEILITPEEREFIFISVDTVPVEKPGTSEFDIGIVVNHDKANRLKITVILVAVKFCA